MAEADLRRELETLRKDLATLRGDVTTLSETAGKTTKETIQEIMDAAKEATANARAKLMEEADHVVRNVKAGATDVAGQVRQTGAQMIEGVEQKVEEKPMTAVLTALGVGFVVGWMMTRR